MSTMQLNNSTKIGTLHVSIQFVYFKYELNVFLD